jgi:mycothiol synthase
MSVTMRPYAGEADYAPLRHLFDVVAGASPLHYGTAGDLDWWRFAHEDPDVLRHAALWCADDGTIVGFAWPKGDEVEVESHPAHRDLEGAIFAWAEAQAASQSPPAPLLAARCFDEDAPRVAALRARGYVRMEMEQAYRYRSRPLTGELPERVVPPGFTVRALGGDNELAARVAVHRAAFAPSRMTVAKHRSVRTAPGYRPDLDLVAVTPDGTFGAYCIVWFDPVNRLGVFEPVGADPAWQRRGLARAVLTEGFYRLRALGATTAFVACRRDNVPADALYEAVGFRLVGKDQRWEKALGGG